jgi:hypothetical protein
MTHRVVTQGRYDPVREYPDLKLELGAGFHIQPKCSIWL